MAIRVLMLGGLRSGKTSLLASMFEEAINGPLHDVLTIYDETMYEDKGYERQDTLISKNLELEDYLSNPPSCVFLPTGIPSKNVSFYKLSIGIHGYRKISIDFIDLPGMFFERFNANMKQEDIMAMCDSDVFIVTIDTPYIMECNKSLANYVNKVHVINDILAHLSSNDVRTAKMVLFVPLKCEKWVKEGYVDEVNKKTRELYATTIDALLAQKYVTVGILPVQTAGNMEFVEMQDNYVLFSKAPVRYRQCAKLTDKLVRMTDGKVQLIRDGEELIADESPYSFVSCPKSWYKVSQSPILDDTRLYNPHNCDQILIHILDFIAHKNTVNLNAFLNFNQPHFRALRAALRNLLKNNQEGIEYIKS